MNACHVIPVFLALWPLQGKAQVDRAEAPRNPEAVALQVQVEYLEMSHEALTDLLFLHQPKTSDATLLRKQVQEMVCRKEAFVIETQVIAVRSGQNAALQSSDEIIYPTEYDQHPACGFDRSNPAGSTDLVITPIAFDTRYCGSALEIGARLSDHGKLVKLHLQPDLTWHTGNTNWSDLKDSYGSVLKRDMPDFYSLRLNTVVDCPEGRHLMASILSPKDAKGRPDFTRKVVVFVKCDVVAR